MTYRTGQECGKIRHHRTGRMEIAPKLSFPGVDDETLIGLIDARDELALSSLYERYSRRLYQIALRITGDAHSAEEVIQDAFQSVWLRASQFRSNAGTVQAWLSGIVRNRAIDEARSRWQRARATEISLDTL